MEGPALLQSLDIAISDISKFEGMLTRPAAVFRPLTEVAKKFGMCTTAFKKLCRKQGIMQWP